MLFLSCAYYEPWWAYLLRMLFEGTAELMLYSTPVAICAVVWDVFANKESPRTDVSFLGLDEGAQPYSPTVEAVFPLWTVLLYLLTGVATFSFGVYVFDTVQGLL
jgi:hypothetical protein